MCLATSGIILLVLGGVFTVTGVGAIVGIPLAILGVVVLVLGLAGGVLSIIFAVLKIVLTIIFSPILLLVWLLRWLGGLLF